MARAASAPTASRPGVTMTDMVRHRFDDEVFKRANVETTPYPRLAEPDDIASVIAFLCSPGSEMLNGQSIVVDGGWTGHQVPQPARHHDQVGGGGLRPRRIGASGHANRALSVSRTRARARSPPPPLHCW